MKIFKLKTTLYTLSLLASIPVYGQSLSFSCNLAPLTIEVYTDKNDFYKPHKLIAYRLKGFEEVVIEDATWDVGGTGPCAAASWNFKLNNINYTVSEMSCYGDDYPPPSNANGMLTINDEWFWCYK